MDKVEKEFSHVPCDNVRTMVETQANYVFLCLQTFHPITMHCKVLDFEKECANINFIYDHLVKELPNGGDATVSNTSLMVRLQRHVPAKSQIP